MSFFCTMRALHSEADGKERGGGLVGAASVLGKMVIRYAKKLGLKTINVVRRDEQKEELASIGYLPSRLSCLYQS